MLVALPVLGLVAIAATVVFGTAGNVNADTCPAATCSDTVTVQVTVGAVISLSTPDRILVDMAIPTSSGVFASGSGEIGVSTNDSTGYSVYITGTSGDTNRRLTHESVSSSYFAPISGDQTVASGGKFSTNNTWGWSGDTAATKVYHPLLAYGATHSSSTTTRFVYKTASTIGKNTCTVSPIANYECSNLYIGATGNTSLTAGTYTGTVLITAVPNSSASISSFEVSGQRNSGTQVSGTDTDSGDPQVGGLPVETPTDM